MSADTDQIRITLTQRQIEALEDLVGIRGSTSSKVASSIITDWLYQEGMFPEVNQD